MKSYLKFFIVTGSLALVGLLGTPVRAADDLSAQDKKFVMKAAMGGMTEVELGKLAAAQASSSEVKDFGTKMVSDHGKAGDELKSIATAKGLDLPAKLDEKHQAMVDNMKAMSGTAFDKAYVDAMVMAHKKDDALFSKEGSAGTDADIKGFATKTDETVKMHLSMIEGIQAKMK